MLSMKKAPAQAVSGETNAGAQEGMSNSIRSSAFWKVPARVISYQKSTCQGPIVAYGGPSGLTEGRLSATVKAPKYNERRTASAIPVLPQRAGRSTGKSIAESSAYHVLPVVHPAGACLYWQVRCPGQPQGPGSLSLGWGAPCLPLFLIFNSQNNEVSYE